MAGAPLFSIADADVPRSLRGTATSLRDAGDPAIAMAVPPADLDERAAAAFAGDLRSSRRLVAGAGAVVVALLVVGVLADALSACAGPAVVVAGFTYAEVRARRAARTLPGPWQPGQLVQLRRGGRNQGLPCLLAGEAAGVPVRRFLDLGRCPSPPGLVWYRGEMRGHRATLLVVGPDRTWATRAAGAIPRGRWAVVSRAFADRTVSR